MKTRPIIPATRQHDADGLPWSAEYRDIYHPAAGARLQAEHVFLAGSGLPARWRGRERFVVLETGFGLGNNFLATWQAWRSDGEACGRLHFISIEKHPLRAEDLREAHRSSPAPGLAAALVEAWPPLTANLHRLEFDAGRVQLLLAFGDVSDWLPELVAEVDAFYLDGFAPARNADMWQPRVYKAMARLAAPQASVATWTAARAVREGLAAAGFEANLAPGKGGKRDITLARYAPSFVPRRAPARAVRTTGDSRHAVVLGAGLAGAAAAWALAEQGWTSTVIDRQPEPALETSGNPAGLFHGIVHPQDGPHARFGRAAAFEAARAATLAIEDHAAPGQVAGLLRLTNGESDLDEMRALLSSQALPADFVQALSADQASEACGLAIDSPAWFYPRGGWVSPGGLVRSFLDRAGTRATFLGSRQVDSIARTEAGWRLVASDGGTVAEGETLVLANAGEALKLLSAFDGSDWPVEAVRGQISSASVPEWFHSPRLPVAGNGYLLPPANGRMLFGATSRAGDRDGTVRTEDHGLNLAQLARMSDSLNFVERLRPGDCLGRVGWRIVARDRLPLVGGAPDRQALAARRVDQPARVPRLPGLHLFTALGSRGITWAALAARVLASGITGAPCPVEASLLDAIDAARFVARAARNG